MPGRRQVKAGSFGGDFDELVKHFALNSANRSGRAATPGKSKTKAKALASLNQKLFDRASALDRQHGEDSA